MKIYFEQLIKDIKKIATSEKGEFKYNVISFFDDLIHPLRLVKYGIENFISYFKIIWKDRDWDYCFLLRIIQFKLKRMVKSMIKYHNHEDVEKTIKQINFCLKRLECFFEDDYCKKEWLTHEAKFGRNMPLFITRLDSEESKSFMEIMYRCDRKKVRDIKLLFACMGKHITEWWD